MRQRAASQQGKCVFSAIFGMDLAADDLAAVTASDGLDMVNLENPDRPSEI